MVEIKPDSQAAREALFLDLYALSKEKIRTESHIDWIHDPHWHEHWACTFVFSLFIFYVNRYQVV